MAKLFDGIYLISIILMCLISFGKIRVHETWFLVILLVMSFSLLGREMLSNYDSENYPEKGMRIFTMITIGGGWILLLLHFLIKKGIL
ncbi:MAG: hypothetical protein SOX70_00560 [Peptoniphilaceae bacterium]|nr:hypothetical protein [Peptoniphilaceae bacterium]MDY3987013.1 hypothetical protein [Peptoniphilaceae bacterium]MDY4195734.1 hypothetical protein [Peptoniphilaceae bacterium]